MSTPPHTPASPQPPSGQPDPAPRRLTRSSTDRMVGGVCGGIGRYVGIDPTLVRIATVALVLLGGTGLVVYAAALVLVPLDGDAVAAPSRGHERRVAAMLVVGFVIACIVFGSSGFFGGALVPVAFLALAGLSFWWFATGQRATGTPRDIMRRMAAGIGLLIGCFGLAAGSFFASGLGGGVVVSALVILAGAGLIAGAFVGGARWLVLPALAIALPLAFVSAAGIDLHGGFGQRHERPGSLAEMKGGYRLGAGELIVDLRGLKLPPGDQQMNVDIGAGHALVLVPDGVCVASRATVGMGGVAIFDRDSGGIDVSWKDSRRAPPRTPRLIVDGDVGVGFLEVRHHDDGRFSHDHFDDHSSDPSERNTACATTTANAAGSAGATTG